MHALLLSLGLSSCGDWLYNVALLALVYARTGSATWVAVTTATRVLPIVVLGPLGGAIADRYDRRRLLVISDLTRAGLMAALALVAAAGGPIVLAPLLAALATAAGSATPPCVAACTARIVPESDLQRANAIRAGVGQAAIVIGPALGALLLLAAGPAVAILLNGLTFLASATVLAAISSDISLAPTRGSDQPLPSLWADIRAGARALRGTPAAIRLVGADVICSAVYGLLTVTLVLVGRRAGAGAGAYGLLLAACGIGGVLGATLVGRIAAANRWRGTLACALAFVGVSLGLLGTVSGLAEAIGLALVLGSGMVVGEVLSETALPRLLGEEVLARAYGLALPAALGGIVAGSLSAGPLVSWLGLRGTLVSAGAFVLLSGVWLLRRPLTSAVRPLAAAET